MPLSDHLRAGLVLLTGFAMLVLGFPGLDQLPKDWLQDDVARAAALQRPGGRLQILWADLNHIRQPIERAFAPLQRPLRIAQSWSLYGMGPNRVRRAEIRVDGELWFRSGDPDHTWLRAYLRFRRIRPVLANTCVDESPHSAQLMDFITKRALEDAPQAQEIELRCTMAAWPGTDEGRVNVRWVARAPHWAPDWESTR